MTSVISKVSRVETQVEEQVTYTIKFIIIDANVINGVIIIITENMTKKYGSVFQTIRFVTIG